MTPNKKNVPAVNHTTETNEQVPNQSSTRKSTRRTTGRKPRRRSLALHLIVREELNHREAMCGHRINRKNVIPYTGKQHPKYEFRYCQTCEDLRLLDEQVNDEMNFALADHMRQRLIGM